MIRTKNRFYDNFTNLQFLPKSKNLGYFCGYDYKTFLDLPNE